MSAKKEGIVPDWTDPDEIPDLSTDEWANVIEAIPVRRGKPKTKVTKVSTTIRLDPDVLEAFKSEGPGWQGRMNDALRKAVGLPAPT
ncbi:MAG: BrnA antitoxin family protein [Rhodobacteraceae bacterium]|nr:BrnA antitoxin family protein [Paracoccaceae bacterium]MCY4197171.1 BrnA antitoxin family protein [Paracoccaceae bacterium]